MLIEQIRADLFSMQDSAYRDFQCRLMPTVPRERVIGVRIPQLRAYARRIENADEFMAQLPHVYYEENNLHGFLIEKLDDFGAAVTALDRFLPFVDNWATCDMMRPAVLGTNPTALRGEAYRWMQDNHPYTVRYGIEMLMLHCLGADFSPEDPAVIAALPCDHYYVSMMVAWYFATALTLRYADVLPYLTEQHLDRLTHNRTIAKARESKLIPARHKAELYALRIKK